MHSNFFSPFKSMTKRPYFTGGGEKKKIISTEMDDGLLCWRQNSCNRNGNVLPLSDHVRFWDAFSRVAIWVTGLSYFPPLCLCWLPLITQWDAESGLFRAWQKSNLMNLMRLFDLSDPPHTHTDTGGHLFSLILSTVLWGWSLSQYVLGRSQENTLDKLWVHKRADRDKQTRSYASSAHCLSYFCINSIQHATGL